MTTNGFCECGCGEKTSLAPHTDRKRGWVKSQPVRYIHTHRARKSSGVKVKTTDGYWQVLVHEGDDFFCMSKMHGCASYVLEHRLVMARHIGRALKTPEVVHHENEVKTDNDIANLRLFPDQAAHQAYHAALQRT